MKNQSEWGPWESELTADLAAIDDYLNALVELRNLNIADIEPSDYVLKCREKIVDLINARSAGVRE